MSQTESGTEIGPAEPESSPRIQTLASAAASTAGDGDDWILTGWDADGAPMATTAIADLDEAAAAAFRGFRASGLWPRQVNFASVEAVEFVMTGAAVDFADHAGQVAQDQVQLIVVDRAGNRLEYSLGELVLMEAIVQARDPWQAALPGSSAELARAAIPFYTLYLPHPRGREKRGLAILFRATTPTSGNEAVFGSFVRQTLSRLLVLDESQPPDSRKGYLEAAARSAGVRPGDHKGLLAWLQKLGFVDYDEPWMASLEKREAGLMVGMLRALRKVGLLEVSDERLEELEDVRPVYDLDRLDVAGLTALAEAMYQTAKRLVGTR